MSSAATTTILNAVSHARRRAQSAEREFDNGADLIQLQASRSIDLFGGSATSQVADIVRKSVQLCDTLYATYQSLIVTLDEECRPLLSEQPELDAVREVTELIQWLNSESEITNNFTASLNTSSLGDVATRAYSPSMQCRMIQNYWESRYDQWPGRAEELARKREAAARLAERRRQEEEKRRQEEEAKRKEQEVIFQRQQAEYEAAVAAREEIIAAAKSARNETLREMLEQERRERLCMIQQEFESTKTDLSDQLRQAELDLEIQQEQLSSYNFFQSKKKKRSKKAIAEYRRIIAHLNQRLQENESRFAAQNAALPGQLDALRTQLIKELDAGYTAPPMPQAPKKPAPVLSGISGNAQMVIHRVLEVMDDDELLTISEIMQRLDMPDLTNQRLSACIRMAVPEYLERVEDKRKAYFRKV